MKKKIKSYLALFLSALLLTTYLGGVAVAVDAFSKIGAGTASTGTHSLEFANVVLFKQATKAFVWVSDEIDTSSSDKINLIKDRIKASDDSVKNYTYDAIFVITGDSFNGNEYDTDPQYAFSVTINQTPTADFPSGSYTISGINVSHVGLYEEIISTGSLKVTKDVSGDGASSEEEFAITVQFEIGDIGSLSDILYNGAATDTSGTGTYALSLSDGESATFTNIPLGVSYTVSESLTADQTGAGWTGPEQDATGTITGTALVEVTVENVYDPEDPPTPGTLKVTKTVAGVTSKWNGLPFEFTVTFDTGTDEHYGYESSLGYDLLNLSYVNDADESGVTFTFYLGDGDWIEFYGIEAGTEYTVTETDDQDAYCTTTGDPATGTFERIGENGDGYVGGKSVTFINTYTDDPPPPTPGTLKVTKTVAGVTSKWNGLPFEFTVTFDTGTDEHYGYESSLGYDLLNLSYVNDADESGVTFTFYLGDGDWIEFYGIEAGTAYTVTETNARSANGTTTGGDPATGTFTTMQGENGSYVINRSVAFTNTYTDDPPPPPPPPGYYNLTVVKEIDGSGASATDRFSFDVTLANPFGVTYTVNDGAPVNVAAGTTSLTLSGGDVVVFRTILEGTGFSVTETDPGDYTVGVTASAGVTVLDASASGNMYANREVTFTNMKDAPPPPPPPTTPPPEETGVLGAEDEDLGTGVLPQTDGISAASALAILGAMMAGTGAVLGFKKKKEDDE